MKTQKQQGFTIIEVVLVLAIAGLIFLVVFLAVPALQRSQRDTQRRQDVGKAASLMQQWQSNNKGNVPTTAAERTDYQGYLTADSFEDPSFGGYTYAWNAAGAPGNGALSINTGSVCGTSGAVTSTGAGARNVAFRIKLESGGTYCQSI